jgi:hypothetical protein
MALSMRELRMRGMARRGARAALSMSGLALAATLWAGPVRAGDPSAVVGAVADAPPETQVRILRMVLKDMFGSRAELKARFIAACAERHATRVPDKSERSLAAVAQEKAGELSRAAVLAALCSGPARARVEAALTPPGGGS